MWGVKKKNSILMCWWLWLLFIMLDILFLGVCSQSAKTDPIQPNPLGWVDF